MNLSRPCCLLLVSLIWFVSASHLEAQTAREYDLKATLVFNFSQFVEWPANALADTNAPFVIGILGSDPFGRFLADLVKDERANGRPIQIRRFRSVEDAFGANILFISKSEQARLPSILAALNGRPILTVGEAGDRAFSRRGGMIALVTEKDNIRLRVNLDAARASGLTISAKVLRLAEIVTTER